MARRSRSKNEAPLSLFSFQDIMTSVMGILIFVTLMMAADLTDSVGSAMTIVRSAERDGEPLADAAALRREEQEWRRKYEDLLGQVVERSAVSGVPGIELARERARIERAQEELRELERAIERTREATATSTRAELAAAMERVVSMELRARQLRYRLDAMRANPRLTYLVQPGVEKSALLVELGSDAIGLGSPREEDPAIWLMGSDASLRKRQFRAWLGTRDPMREYFVVLVKPSAFGEPTTELLEVLRSEGFEVGLDLLEEREHVLPSE